MYFTTIITVTQVLRSPVETGPRLHVCCLKSNISMSSVSPLSHLSLKRMSLAQPPLLIHYACYMATTLRTTLCKQPFFLSLHVVSLASLWSLLLDFSTFCPFADAPVSIASLTPFLPLGQHAVQPPLCLLHQTTHSPHVYHLPLKCHTCYFFFLSPLPLSAVWHSVSQMEMQLWVRAERCAEYLLQSPDSFFLSRICLPRSHQHLRCCRLHLLTSPSLHCVWQQLPGDGRGCQLHLQCVISQVNLGAYPHANQSLAKNKISVP